MVYAFIVIDVALAAVAFYAGYRYGHVVATEAANVKASVSADVAKVEGTAAKVISDVRQ
jgi:multidrug resistance efflux pump